MSSVVLIKDQITFAQTVTVDTEILDNPIWHALTTNNSKTANGDSSVQFMDPELGLFAAMQTINREGLLKLAELAIPQQKIILFVPELLDIPQCWNIKVERALLQMVYREKQIDFERTARIRSLSAAHVSQMLQLTKLTNPGPFFHRTIELGNYEGIFHEENLVAMAGQRLRPASFTEISAVCTDPSFLGKGYASLLIRSQINAILQQQQTPFLHLFPENSPALQLYTKLGFTIRKEMRVYFLENQSA